MDYVISSDPSWVDVDVVWRFLSEQSYWATFAYLADVFVLTEHRGQGLSKRLLEAVLAHPELRGLRRWLLFTADAHTLYEQFGFVRTMYPERIMEIRRPYIGDQ
ncbi:MAG: GNAT family N-acetyltransferase [Chthoniobacterales bacterium]|jgi:GNAT superfamily N-acetyltransferase